MWVGFRYIVSLVEPSSRICVHKSRKGSLLFVSGSMVNLMLSSMLLMWLVNPYTSYSWISTYVSSTALYVTLLQLDTIGLSRWLALWILGVPLSFGGSSESGYNRQYRLSEICFSLFHLLRVLTSLFLYLLVGSLLSFV